MLVQKRVSPKISQELVDWLRMVFTDAPITPSTRIEEVMYQSGQKSVIDFLQSNIKESTIEAFNNRSV